MFALGISNMIHMIPKGAVQVARGRAIIPANKRHTELEPTVVGKYYGTCPELIGLTF